VTRFEPRTPHQPEKLKKLSKNEYVFTPSIFYVNENFAFVSTPVFNRVHAVHRPMTGNSATADLDLSPPPVSGAAFRRIRIQYCFAHQNLGVRNICENRRNAAQGKQFVLPLLATAAESGTPQIVCAN
jgi:hypothetical protein